MLRLRPSLRIAALASPVLAAACHAGAPPVDPPHAEAATTASTSEGRAFPREDARTALAAAARGLRSCGVEGRAEDVVADVRFEPSGGVSAVDVDGPDADTRACVRGKLAEVAVTPFDGRPVTMQIRVRL